MSIQMAFCPATDNDFTGYAELTPVSLRKKQIIERIALYHIHLIKAYVYYPLNTPSNVAHKIGYEIFAFGS